MLHEYWIFSDVLHFFPDLSIDKEFKWMEVTEWMEAWIRKNVFSAWEKKKEGKIKVMENSLFKYSQKLM